MYRKEIAQMAELVDAADLKSADICRGGSIPPLSTKYGCQRPLGMHCTEGPKPRESQDATLRYVSYRGRLVAARTVLR